jgi:hypothetical protein
MTIAAAWVRKLSNGAEEMFFCSDSRMCGGKRFDHCQKTFRFTRTDAAITFAGGADWAYPMIIAAINATDIHVPSTTRQRSLPKFRSHVVNILNQMQSEVHNFASGEEIPDVVFLFGGYDWWSKSFKLWRIKFDQQDKQFVAHEQNGSSGFGGLGKLEVAGDEDHVTAFRERLKVLAQSRYGRDMRQPATSRFNMEPFEIIRDLLRHSDADSTIGGSPQGAKIYQYMSSADIGVFWPNVQDGHLFLCGRPLLDYERASIKSIIDPDTLNSTWCSGGLDEAAAQIKSANLPDADRTSEEGPLADESAE